MTVTTATLSDYTLLVPPGAYGASGGFSTFANTSGDYVTIARMAMLSAIRVLRCTFSAPPFAAGSFLLVASHPLGNSLHDCVSLGASVSRLLRR